MNGRKARAGSEVDDEHDDDIVKTAKVDGPEADQDDAARLLLDEARVLDGERPTDARGFPTA
jgi:hypothetical protein